MISAGIFLKLAASKGMASTVRKISADIYIDDRAMVPWEYAIRSVKRA